MKYIVENSQKQILSHQMIQSVNILQMSAQELESYLEEKALENPVIEFDHREEDSLDKKEMELQRKLEWLDSSDFQNHIYYEQDGREENLYDRRVAEEDLKEYLSAQLLFSSYTKKEKEIIDFLILSLDSKGYLSEDTSYVADLFQVDVDKVEELLKTIQELDPAGVGARNLKECLLLQIERQEKENSTVVNLAKIIIKKHMDDLAKNHLHKITKACQATKEEVAEACCYIKKLNPKPGASFSDREQLRYIAPDVIVVKLENRFEVLINEYQYPSFHISVQYTDMLQQVEDMETKEYLRKKIGEAETIQKNLQQRTSTLTKVMRVLVQKQSEFFLKGTGYKQPMSLRDIADELQLHESTVSRALHGKYVQCIWGIYPLNYFLATSVTKHSQMGEEVTAERIKCMISEIVDREDKKKPYSDQKISDLLHESGLKVSRRTINKYRLELGIPDKSGRKR